MSHSLIKPNFKFYFFKKDSGCFIWFYHQEPRQVARFFVYRHLVLVVVDKNNYANCYAIF